MVIVYHNTVPNGKSQEKIDMLNFFGQGIQTTGEKVVNNYTFQFEPSRVAVIQGWITDVIDRPHLVLRQAIIRSQLSSGNHVVTVDSNLFLYANTRNPLHYLRYSFDGVFPNTGIYCDSMVDDKRWDKISRDLGIALKPYRKSGDHILLCLQRNGGWSMGNMPVLDWAADVILKIRQYSDRPIRIRPHPGDKSAASYLGNLNDPSLKKLGVELSTNRCLIDDLKNCWAAVNHNSSPVVGAIIEGVPAFVTDPLRSQCREVANLDFSTIENPKLHDREAWIRRLAMSHWNFDELKSGECWRWMQQFI